MSNKQERTPGPVTRYFARLSRRIGYALVGWGQSKLTETPVLTDSKPRLTHTPELISDNLEKLLAILELRVYQPPEEIKQCLKLLFNNISPIDYKQFFRLSETDVYELRKLLVINDGTAKIDKSIDTELNYSTIIGKFKTGLDGITAIYTNPNYAQSLSEHRGTFESNITSLKNYIDIKYYDHFHGHKNMGGGEY